MHVACFVIGTLSSQVMDSDLGGKFSTTSFLWKTNKLKKHT